MAMMKNLTIKAGNCNHKRYIPRLLDLIRTGAIHPERLVTSVRGMTDAVSAYHAFAKHEPGWIKVELEPQPQV
jgi:threonine dehydrogenase-like Zn-dependent dehydrogenase